MKTISLVSVCVSVFLLSASWRTAGQVQPLRGTFVNPAGAAWDEAMQATAPATDLASMKNLKSIRTQDALVKRPRGSREALEISLGASSEKASVDIPFKPGLRLDDWVSVAIDITNLGQERIYLEGQCFSDGDQSLVLENGAYFYYRSMLVLEPGETDTMIVFLSRDMESMPAYMYDHFQGMFGIPGGFLRRKVNVPLSHFTHLRLFKQFPGREWKLRVEDIRTLGRYNLPSRELLETSFFPFIDRFGQYKWTDWDGKVKRPEDLYAQREAEERDLAANPVSDSWDKWGGWKDGPQLRATGHFRVEKYNGKWWLVDPDGHLFFSQGICGVGLTQVTRIQGREKYFEYKPLNGDFYLSNLITKYQGAPDFAMQVVDNASRRMKSWGINTMASWSLNDQFSEEQRLPYTITLSSGIRDRLPDDFDAAAFKAAFRESLLAGRSNFLLAAQDPWCIGFFVDNERGWPTVNQREIIYAYFKAVREVLDELAPDKLYLGCRSNSVNFNRIAFEAQAEYCDVMSINHYDYNLSTFKETEGLDKPLIVGEYHFGALDRGLAHTGLRTAPSQKQRARIYRHFVEEALESDYIVGTHWFQYVDQCFTARSDGENYQIGFVDICDRPHPEMIAASREIKKEMYTLRYGR
ncbi:MAG: hypothetical protein IJ578_07210 [Bacteroidales bacterium]|nr:hypothetical protein [Bacteroidales bacterium]